MLVSLQGKIHIGARLTSGKPGVTRWVGNVSESTISLATEATNKSESYSGNRLQLGRLQTAKSATFKLTMDEWLIQNLAFGLYGKQLAVAGGSATAEVLPSPLVVGDQVRLANPYASSLVITDSAGSPVTVTSSKYSLQGHNSTIVEFNDVATYTQPFKAAYTYAAYTSLDAFTQTADERWVIFDGINTETGEAVLVDLYRCRFDPFEDIGLIHPEYGALAMSGSVLYDPLNDDGTNTGGFMKYRIKT